MNFIVDRTTWRRGKDVWNTLLDAHGGRCCIGFAASQCGISDEILCGVPTVSSLAIPELPDNGIQTGPGGSTWVRRAYEVNDNSDIDDATREARLKELAIEGGHTFEFIN